MWTTLRFYAPCGLSLQAEAPATCGESATRVAVAPANAGSDIQRLRIAKIPTLEI